jgi:hypothetical protein
MGSGEGTFADILVRRHHHLYGHLLYYAARYSFAVAVNRPIERLHYSPP